MGSLSSDVLECHLLGPRYASTRGVRQQVLQFGRRSGRRVEAVGLEDEVEAPAAGAQERLELLGDVLRAPTRAVALVALELDAVGALHDRAQARDRALARAVEPGPELQR